MEGMGGSGNEGVGRRHSRLQLLSSPPFLTHSDLLVLLESREQEEEGRGQFFPWISLLQRSDPPTVHGPTHDWTVGHHGEGQGHASRYVRPC